jgi:hypothetical protein
VDKVLISYLEGNNDGTFLFNILINEDLGLYIALILALAAALTLFSTSLVRFTTAPAAALTALATGPL